MAAGLLAYDSEVDYVSDVFVGPRKDPLERAIAVDYTRHGIELHRWSETELAAIFKHSATCGLAANAKPHAVSITSAPSPRFCET